MSTLREQLHDAETENASFSKAIAALPPGTAPEPLLKLKADSDEKVRSLKAQLAACDSGNSLYDEMCRHSPYPITPEFRQCVGDAVSVLEETGDNANQPVLLLGKVQCGKTNTFEKIIALCMDKGFEIFVVLTKNSNALSEQTLNRLRRDFKCIHFNGNGEDNSIYDIMSLKKGLSSYIAENHRIIIVAKKETRNLDRLIHLFSEANGRELANRKVLIIDDEADNASRGYAINRDARALDKDIQTELAKIGKQLETFRAIVHDQRYLQVTATPYSLYLQPDGSLELVNGKVSCFKPRKTIIMPTHDAYIGGHQYFVESEDEASMYHHLRCPLSDECVRVMNKSNRVYLGRSLFSDNIADLRLAIISYFMAVAIRNLQQSDETHYKTSCIVHVCINKGQHSWQKNLIDAIIDAFTAFIEDQNVDQGQEILQNVHDIYHDYCSSHQKGMEAGLIDVPFPLFDNVMCRMREIIQTKNYTVKIVNSDEEVAHMLNESGQLRLETVANIFIGGNVLDRGITLDHLLTFVYGRTTTKQMDTALQHERMYGSRSKEDMAVTRFFTTDNLYKRLKDIHLIDEHLRARIANGDIDNIVIETAPGLAPTMKQKILVSDVLTVKPSMRILPVGMQTGYKSYIQKTVEQIDALIQSCGGCNQTSHFLMDIATAKKIIHLIRKTYVFNNDQEDTMNGDIEWNVDEMLMPLEYAMENIADKKLFCWYRTGRTLRRKRDDSRGGFIDSPDYENDKEAKNLANNRPVLLLLKNLGLKDKGWRGAEFYWPVLYLQNDVKPALCTIGEKH